jgi:TetR/AcrR family transcriptional regulator, repressor for uid operon
MNVHSRAELMVGIIGTVEVDTMPPTQASGTKQRRERILDAFELCIQRAGFHRTTMQDVAREAGMSAGNLYRYFESKEALVSGMIGRDRERFGADFRHVAQSNDVMGAFIALGRKHFVETPRARCVQFMEIWAEATRDPTVAAVCSAVDREVNDHMIAILEAAKASGQIPGNIDCAATITVLSAMGDGLFTRRALEPDFDAEEGFRLLVNVMDALMSGKVDLNRHFLEGTDTLAPAASEGINDVRA